MYRPVQIVLLGVLAAAYGLSALSRRFPRVALLQVFRHNAPRLSEKQRATIRRRVNSYAGIELILMGIVLPMIYVVSNVMFFSSPTSTGIGLVTAGSLLLIGLGTTAIWRNRRR